MPELRIQITNRADGAVILRCTRADGSVTWQRQEGRQARFFPVHDLTHYAVETTLGFRRGFFGLLADGWDIDDTGGKGARGPLPPEALVVERIVGFLDVERASGTKWTAAEFNEQAALHAESHGIAERRILTDDELARVRARVRELHERWWFLPAGETLELSFDRATS